MYSKFRHPCNRQTTTLVLLYKLFLYCCLWLIKLTTPVVNLVLAAFLLQRCLNLLYKTNVSELRLMTRVPQIGSCWINHCSKLKTLACLKQKSDAAGQPSITVEKIFLHLPCGPHRAPKPLDKIYPCRFSGIDIPLTYIYSTHVQLPDID